MDKFLRIHCSYHLTKDCHPEIIKESSVWELEPGESIPLIGPNEPLDKICHECPHGQFEIETRECRVCGSSNIDSGILKLSYGSNTLSRTIYPYKCLGCGRRLYSIKKLE